MDFRDESKHSLPLPTKLSLDRTEMIKTFVTAAMALAVLGALLDTTKDTLRKKSQWEKYFSYLQEISTFCSDDHRARVCTAHRTSVSEFLGRYKEKRWDSKRMLDSGGMPWSHFATVSALTVAIGLQEGLGSSSFTIAVVLACIIRIDTSLSSFSGLSLPAKSGRIGCRGPTKPSPLGAWGGNLNGYNNDECEAKARRPIRQPPRIQYSNDECEAKARRPTRQPPRNPLNQFVKYHM
ncbi:hypothetical protein WN944_027702 [Citrus x changshan-huyou]|uniref:Uncharacterized protein n=1 Tax=Citrus x changshan-huyou TaxID=2935761 RepID=A0AAP0LIZ7_9ROSI